MYQKQGKCRLRKVYIKPKSLKGLSFFDSFTVETSISHYVHGHQFHRLVPGDGGDGEECHLEVRKIGLSHFPQP